MYKRWREKEKSKQKRENCNYRGKKMDRKWKRNKNEKKGETKRRKRL